MKREMVSLMRAAGYQIEWRNLRGGSRDSAESAQLVVLSLNGVCAPGRGQGPSQDALPADASLATTSISDGRVLPFSTMNCGALTRALAPALASEAGARRDFLYGRAMARVAAHEFYHALAGTREHAARGIARSCFTQADLLSERFHFEAATLARLRPAPVYVEPDEGSGR